MGVEADDRASLRALFEARQVAALGTLHRGEPAVSMVPFVLPRGETRLIIHVSSLATHTLDMRRHPRVSLLVMAELQPGAAPQALPRVALQADASTLPHDGEAYGAARRAYLERFPQAQITFELADFSVVALQPVSARLIAGFGRAGALSGAALGRWLRG